MTEPFVPDDEAWAQGIPIPECGEPILLKPRDAQNTNAGTAPGIAWRGTSDIFQPLPETKWLARGLHIGPGRPILLAGYGASAKTLSSQALALAVASGTPVWGNFATALGEVRHLDYEQGFHATARRYQRLAVGHNIDPSDLGERLKLSVFPSVFLDSPNAVDAYSSACEGADLCILDALRGATPSQDENDSSIRACLDNLTRVSEKTGTAFVVLHHAGKPKDGHSDPRTIARGSSAIFDACGCVLVVTPGKTKDKPRNVTQVKQPAEAVGGGIDDFTLRVEDVAVGGVEAAGVRVAYASLVADSPVDDAAARFHKETASLLLLIRGRPGESQNTIFSSCGFNRTRAAAALRYLEEHDRVQIVDGPRGAKKYFAGG
jgi:hypothetical protein